MKEDFVHLHTHSHYSLLNALPKIEDLIEKAVKEGMKTLALTDNGNLYGAIEFYKACKEAKIKPIIGVDFYVALRSRFNKDSGVDNRRYRLVLLAKNEVGYKNLIKLVTDSNLEGFYYKPRIDRELMEKYKEGLVAINPSFSGEVTFHIKTHDFERAEKIIEEHKAIYGDDYYLEISHHPEIPGHQEIQKEIIKIGEKTKTPLVACNEIFYMEEEDKAARNTLISIQNNSDFGDNSRLTDTNENFSFINTKTALKYFKNTPEAIENTLKVAEKCNLELNLGAWVFPNIGSEDPNKDFRDLVEKGLIEKGIEETPIIRERMEYELKVIADKGYAPYFLVVADLMKYAHENKILTNIRGSVSGSLVTYLANITNINPIEYDIPFERFLNPERPSAPDIDMDFADNRRDEMIQYAVNKYGKDNVAQIGTFGTMAARGAVRDVARALGYEYSVGDNIAKLIPMGAQGFPMTIDRAMEEEPELKKLYRNDDDAREIIDMAKKIEGCARHISVHAAGVVISPKPLTEYTPIQLDPKGKGVITQYDMYSVEEAGLLKFDFLGIRNLSILRDALRRVKKIRNLEFDIEKIPLDDKKTFEMLAKGETEGLFQLNGDGMTKYLKDLKPTTIHDINAMVALYRPGPIQFIPLFLDRKHGKSKVEYPDKALEPILNKTYGVLVYQDDLLMIAHKIAGYSWGELDKFRKAVGKKIPEEMAKQKAIFIKGCMDHSKWPQKKAEELWTWIEPFAAYGFNKAHSVSYGKVAYETAYMKANFPVEYMAAVLTAEAGDVDKIAEAIEECKRMKIPILPPDINESLGFFTVVDKNGKISESEKEVEAIRFGLFSIKNFGEGIGGTIFKEVQDNGKFASLEDFLSRIKDRNLNKKSLESLIKCGAMDKFGERGKLLFNIEKLLEYHRESNNTPLGQDSLFGSTGSKSLPKLNLVDVPPVAQEEKLAWERDLLGLYVSGHPLDKYREKLEESEFTISRTKENFRQGMLTVASGMVTDKREILTKKGDKMAFLKISDMKDSIELVAFPETYEKYKNILVEDKIISIKGRVSEKNGEKSILVEAAKNL
jgi:DNA polymerase III subunit alpha